MKDNDIIRKGGTELVLLSLLKGRDMYGYELRRMIADYSEHLYEIPEGSMYIFLYRLAELGLISEQKEVVGKRTRVYYHLEPTGEMYLEKLYQQFLSSLKGLTSLLATTMDMDTADDSPAIS